MEQRIPRAFDPLPRGLNMGGANLIGADLSGPDLIDAKRVTDEQLAKARTLKEAIMPDGSKHNCTTNSLRGCRG